MKKVCVWLSGILLTLLAVFGLAIHKVMASPKDLRAALHVETADLGIPGITKTYDATITNRGRAPVRITRCDFVDDTMSRGTMMAYAIQRWDDQTQRWQQVLGASRKSFCHPYPLGIVSAKLTSAWLWPRQSLSIGEEATAARDGFQIGDKARFIIFTGEPGDYASSIATDPFTIDEHPTSDVDFRIRH
jgi:hypothetical protein